MRLIGGKMANLIIQLVTPTQGGGLEVVRELTNLAAEDFIQSFGGLPSRMDTLYLPAEKLFNDSKPTIKCYCVVRKSFDLTDSTITIKVMDPEETSTGYSINR